jgi:hypothetical protein
MIKELPVDMRQQLLLDKCAICQRLAPVQVHHIDKDGDDTLLNIVLLCSLHHDMIHMHGYTFVPKELRAKYGLSEEESKIWKDNLNRRSYYCEARLTELLAREKLYGFPIVRKPEIANEELETLTRTLNIYSAFNITPRESELQRYHELAKQIEIKTEIGNDPMRGNVHE